MNAQAELSKISGSVNGSINTITKLSEKFSGSGVDQKMADKARETLKQKIAVSKSNKEISAKVRAKLDMNADNLIGGDK